jgi:murein L,D-transpeptidase YcbB/YkuD
MDADPRDPDAAPSSPDPVPPADPPAPEESSGVPPAPSPEPEAAPESSPDAQPPVLEPAAAPEAAAVPPAASPEPGVAPAWTFRAILPRLLLFGGVMVVAAAVLVALALWRPEESEPEREIRVEIEAILESDSGFIAVLGPPIPAPAGPDTAWTMVRELYERRRANPVWWSEAMPTPAARRFANVIAGIDAEGLDPGAYPVPGIESIQRFDTFAASAPRDSHLRSDSLTAAEIARLDLRMSLAFLRMACHLTEGRVPWRELDSAWRRRGRGPDLGSALVRGVRDDRVAEALRNLAPPHDDYLRLREALNHYRGLAFHGGWPALDEQRDLKRGASGAGIERLRTRLVREGDLDSTHASGREFDRPLERAVRRFQARHGLQPSGVVDARTRSALAVPIAARIRQIEANLERWRWLQNVLEPRSVRVNIPDFTLALWDSGRVRTTMPVVIGQRRSPSPIFSDSITYIEVNPSWRLPKTVLETEILPALKKDPDYPARHNLRLLYTHAKVMPETSWTAPDWTKLWQAEFPFMAVQDPGDENPLGHIKFMCPNEYDVYLHDSNAPGLFGAQRRAYSHGCVRVGRPMEFAAYVLGDTSSTLAYIWDSLMVSGQHRLIRFKPPVPVHVLYWTAWVDTTGTVQFRDDLYGYDTALADYLGRRQPRWRLNPDSLRTDWRARQRRGELAVEP